MSSHGQKDLLLSSNSLWNIVNFRSQIVLALVAEGWKVHIAAPSTAEERAACNLPAETSGLTMQRSGVNPFTEVGLISQFVRLMRSKRPAAFLSWTIKPNIYGALAARAAGVPSILNVSGLGTAFLSGRLFGGFIVRLYRFAFRRARIVFFQNGDDCQLFLQLEIVRASQVRLLPGSGIDLVEFGPTPMPPSASGLRFLLVARMIEQKGVREFVEAARILRRSHPQVRCQLLGPVDQGNRSALAREELQNWNDEGVIEYLGALDDVRPAIAAATVIVLPSYREGVPRILLEAAAMARPLIATDVPGCREVVVDGVNGFLCAPKSGLALAAAIANLAALEPHERERMALASRRLVEERFSVELVTRAYVEAVSDLGQGRT